MCKVRTGRFAGSFSRGCRDYVCGGWLGLNRGRS